MSVNELLRRDAFDDIIASLESLLSQVQTLVDSLDPLNDAQVIADFQALAGALTELTNVAGALTEINNVEADLTAINNVNAALANVNTAADNIANINTVAGIDSDVTAAAAIDAEITSVAGIVSEIQTAASNIQAIIDAPGFAQAAEDARDKAQEWAANPEDEIVENGLFSSLHYAAKAEEFFDLITGLTNYAGLWSGLSGALDSGSTVFHTGEFWFLLEDLADVTTSEPSESNADWKLLTATILKQTLSAAAEYYTQSDWAVGTGETTIDIQHSGDVIVGLNGEWLFDGGWSQSGEDLIIDQELESTDLVAVLKLTDVDGFDPDAFMPESNPADEDVVFAQRDSDSELIKVPVSSLGGGEGSDPNLLGLEFDYYDSAIWDKTKTVSDSGQTYVTAHGFDKCLPITLGTDATNTRRNWTSYMVSQQNEANSQYHHMRFIIDSDNWYMVQWDALGRSAVTESVAGVVNQTLYTTLGTQAHRGAHKLWFFSYSWGSNAGWLSVLSQAQGAVVLVPTINMANITHVQFESFRNTDVLGFSEEDHVFRNYGIYASKFTLG